LLQVEGVQTANIISVAITHDSFAKGVVQIENPEIKQAIEYLRRIYAITELEKNEGNLLRVGVQGEIIDAMKSVMLDALSKTRNNALALIEAFDIPDMVLNSVIGRKDGNIYPELIRAAKYLNPINKTKVFPGIHKFLRPRL